jgi:SWI/SNF related-matrix-associated actin-dependent regulator of chromatin subfamily C
LEEVLKPVIKTVHCNVCGVDCTRVHYHYSTSTDQAGQAKANGALDRDICPRCKFENHYSSSWTGGEFVKIEHPEYSAVPEPEEKWSDEEILHLLEGLELFDEDWNKVADHVRTKTREQCVMKFLQLEIEDKYLEEDLPQNNTASQPQKFVRDLALLSKGRLPLFHADNPILSVVSFMAQMAPPNVTTAATGRSVQEMKDVLQKQLENAPTAATVSTSDKGKEKEGTSTDASAVKDEDVMEVDTAPETAVARNRTGSSEENPLMTLPFALSAARSSALASHEERHITRLVSGAVNLQLQKLQLKLAHFDDFEKLLSAERRDLQRRRQQLFTDRLTFQRRVRSLEEATKKISSNLGGAGLPGAMNPEDAVNALAEAIRTFGVGKNEDSIGVKSSSVDGSVQPLVEGAEGYGKLEI